jgi:hypothetical protein
LKLPHTLLQEETNYEKRNEQLASTGPRFLEPSSEVLLRESEAFGDVDGVQAPEGNEPVERRVPHESLPIPERDVYPLISVQSRRAIMKNEIILDRARVEALTILQNAARFQLGDAMRIASMCNAAQAAVGFDAHDEIMAQGALNDALRYLETGDVSGLRYGAYFMADPVVEVPVRERVL